MKIELLGGGTKKEIEERIKTVAAAGKLSRYKGNVFEVLDSCNDYEKNLKLIKRIIEMGHKSIIEHDYLVFALVDVTPIVEQTIIGNRLTSFTIKSRREVDFRNVGYYKPNFRTFDDSIHPRNKELQETYERHMKYLFNEYGYFVDNNISVEDARFILPYSYHSNIIMGMDARELEKLIIYLLYGKLSEIAELKELGSKLLSIVEEKVPYLAEGINNYSSEKVVSPELSGYKRINNLDVKILSKPQLIQYPNDTDNEILISYIMGKHQYNFKEALKNVNEMDEDVR